MNSDYEKTIYTYCDDVIRFARTLDYDMKRYGYFPIEI